MLTSFIQTNTSQDISISDPSSNSLVINKPSKSNPNDRHLQKTCSTCLKTMRSDHLKSHLETHAKIKSKYYKTPCQTCGKMMRKDNIKRHMKIHKPSEQNTVSLLLNDQKQFNDKCQTGLFVKNALLTENIEPHSLRKEMKEALNIYECYTKPDMNSCSLKTWQHEVLTLIEKPSDREIIWIIGKRGNEGKTWLQKYIEHHFGKRRVFRTCISKDPSPLLHILSKRTLSCTDIFLLNIPRSFDISNVPYTILEDIKDGHTVSSKYNSKKLDICTPNVLIVFSNYSPMINKVSTDRWKIFIIDETNDNLVSSNKDKRKLTEKEKHQWFQNKRKSKSCNGQE